MLSVENNASEMENLKGDESSNHSYISAFIASPCAGKTREKKPSGSSRSKSHNKKLKLESENGVFLHETCPNSLALSYENQLASEYQLANASFFHYGQENYPYYQINDQFSSIGQHCENNLGHYGNYRCEQYNPSYEYYYAQTDSLNNSTSSSSSSSSSCSSSSFYNLQNLADYSNYYPLYASNEFNLNAYNSVEHYQHFVSNNSDHDNNNTNTNTFINNTCDSNLNNENNTSSTTTTTTTNNNNNNSNNSNCSIDYFSSNSDTNTNDCDDFEDESDSSNHHQHQHLNNQNHFLCSPYSACEANSKQALSSEKKRSAKSEASSSCANSNKKKRKRVLNKMQRAEATQREKRRMLKLNRAFEDLRKVLPISEFAKNKLSRAETLKSAIEYIEKMSEMLGIL